MTPEQVTTERVKEIAELEVRKYFDHYQTEIFPIQLKTIIDAHDNDDTAHGSVKLRVDRAVWVFLGVAIASGGAGAFISQALALVGRG